MVVLLIFAFIIILALIGNSYLNHVTNNKSKENQKAEYLATLDKNYVMEYETTGNVIVHSNKEDDVTYFACFGIENYKSYKVENFITTVKVFVGSAIFSFDEKNQKMVLVNKKESNSSVDLFIREFNYDDIISVELIEDGVSIYSKSMSRTIGGTIIGGALAGNAGAIVGGLSGSSKEKKKTKSLKLKISLRDIKHPSFTFIFFENERGYESDNYFYKHFYEKANKLKDIFAVVLDKSKQNKEKTVEQISEQERTGNDTSVVDKLSKLAALLEKGLITEEEFKEQKIKLLS